LKIHYVFFQRGAFEEKYQVKGYFLTLLAPSSGIEDLRRKKIVAKRLSRGAREGGGGGNVPVKGLRNYGALGKMRVYGHWFRGPLTQKGGGGIHSNFCRTGETETQMEIDPLTRIASNRGRNVRKRKNLRIGRLLLGCCTISCDWRSWGAWRVRMH